MIVGAPGDHRRRRSAFTLIELLVVVSIIALLISILLPSLASARDQAKSTVCAAQMQGMTRGLASYTSDSNDWIPGMNTSGVKLRARMFSMTLDVLRDPTMPTQPQDWATPLLGLEMRLPNNRAKRFQLVTERYRCAGQAGIKSLLYPFNLSGVPDKVDFDGEESWTALSYLMPVHFQYWGKSFKNQRLASAVGMPDMPVYVLMVPDDWEARYDGYSSRLGRVGPPSRKVFVADGTRYLPASGLLDHDVSPLPNYFGSFTSSGAWWASSTEYGVQSGSLRWGGPSVSGGSPSNGRNLGLSYRHRGGRNKPSTTCQGNKGAINAAFFDGHVEALGDQKSRSIDLWYPRGAVVQAAPEGMTALENGYVVP